MAESVLIAVDDSAAAQKAVDYVGRMFGGREFAGLSITLFHVVEGVPADLVPVPGDPHLDTMVAQAMHDWSLRAAERGEKLLESHRQRLIEAGIPRGAVTVKHHLQESRPEAQRVAAALAIIEEARSGGYTTVVVGRRGTSNLPELFLGGVAEKVSRHVYGATVWIVD
jgi:nucleotide-binding universal stress UspA family protein